jgi:hypothetical protein
VWRAAFRPTDSAHLGGAVSRIIETVTRPSSSGNRPVPVSVVLGASLVAASRSASATVDPSSSRRSKAVTPAATRNITTSPPTTQGHTSRRCRGPRPGGKDGAGGGGGGGGGGKPVGGGGSGVDACPWVPRGSITTFSATVAVAMSIALALVSPSQIVPFIKPAPRQAPAASCACAGTGDAPATNGPHGMANVGDPRRRRRSSRLPRPSTPAPKVRMVLLRSCPGAGPSSVAGSVQISRVCRLDKHLMWVACVMLRIAAVRHPRRVLTPAERPRVVCHPS